MKQLLYQSSLLPRKGIKRQVLYLFRLFTHTFKLTEKELKQAGSLQEGQTVKVKILSVKDDGTIKSVKFVS